MLRHIIVPNVIIMKIQVILGELGVNDGVNVQPSRCYHFVNWLSNWFRLARLGSRLTFQDSSHTKQSVEPEQSSKTIYMNKPLCRHAPRSLFCIARAN